MCSDFTWLKKLVNEALEKMDKTLITKKSKYLSLLLRHKPEQANLDMTDDGWVEVQQLLSNTEFDIELLDEIVRACDKKRYEFNDDKTQLRARQGHSVKVDLQYKPIVPPQFLYHGTTDRFFYQIFCDGLKKMKRHHIHLSEDENTAVKVGTRHGKPIILIVDAKAMHDLGHKFYKTNNNVWLVDEVLPKYLFLHRADEKQIIPLRM